MIHINYLNSLLIFYFKWFILVLIGEVPERSNGTVLKTVVPERVPWVRIPPSPHIDKSILAWYTFLLLNLVP